MLHTHLHTVYDANIFYSFLSGDSVAIATNLKEDIDEDTVSIADSALGNSLFSGATFTGTQFSEVSCSIHTRTAVNTMSNEMVSLH